MLETSSFLSGLFNTIQWGTIDFLTSLTVNPLVSSSSMYLLIREDIFYDLLGGYLWLSWLWRLNLPSICQFGLVKLGFAGLINNSGFRKSGIFSLLCFCHKLHDFCWVYWHIWCGDLSLVWQPSWWADTFTCNMKKKEKHIKIEDNTIGSNQSSWSQTSPIVA